MPDIISFPEAIKETDGNDRAVLLGNGFSIQYCTNFSYSSLRQKADLKDDDPLNVLFETLATVDFEVVIRALENASDVETAYGNQEQANTFTKDADRLRKALVHAVKDTHPMRGTEIEGIPNCIQFLKQFHRIFTLNYDLLLYWVILETGLFTDGFGLLEGEPGFRRFSESGHCNIFNLHGGLHLFLAKDGEVEKRIRGDNGIVAAIAETIESGKGLPIYVAEGTSEAKVHKINSIRYLRHCYDQLRESCGSFFVYGSSAHQSDAHIYRALFKSKIDHLYFCIHRPNAAKLNETDGKLAYYARSYGSRIGYTFVNAQTARVWDGQGNRGE